jgi:hypothetical protein
MPNPSPAILLVSIRRKLSALERVAATLSGRLSKIAVYTNISQRQRVNRPALRGPSF